MTPWVFSCPLPLVDAVASRVPQASLWLRLRTVDELPALRDALADEGRDWLLRRIELPWHAALADTLRALPGGVRVLVRLSADEAARLDPQLLTVAAERDLSLWASPEVAEGSALADEPAEACRRASLAGWPVFLPPAPWLLGSGEDLLGLLEHYLFHPELAVPVEPFHGQLVSHLRLLVRSLWSSWFGVAEDHFYVGDDGAVSVCATWAANPERQYGTLDGTPSEWQASPAFAALRRRRRGEFAATSPCVDCAVKRPCGGCLLAVNPAADCDAWRELFTRISLAADALGGRAREARRRDQTEAR